MPYIITMTVKVNKESHEGVVRVEQFDGKTQNEAIGKANNFLQTFPFLQMVGLNCVVRQGHEQTF